MEVIQKAGRAEKTKHKTERTWKKTTRLLQDMRSKNPVGKSREVRPKNLLSILEGQSTAWPRRNWSSTTGSWMYRTKFPHRAKILQLERRVVFEIVDVGRIHRQVLLDVVAWLSLGEDGNGPGQTGEGRKQEESQVKQWNCMGSTSCSVRNTRTVSVVVNGTDELMKLNKTGMDEGRF